MVNCITSCGNYIIVLTDKYSVHQICQLSSIWTDHLIGIPMCIFSAFLVIYIPAN